MIAIPSSDHAPGSLRHEEVRERRRALLSLPHVAPLAAYVKALRARTGFEVPDFDPLDGGVEARSLFLFEKPGPMTATSAWRGIGSGFISRNNDDATARASHEFMAQAGIAREDTISWNLIPWWNGTMKITRDEIRMGEEELCRLLVLLPRLCTAVLVGRTAARAGRLLDGLRVFESAHPSMRVRNAFPAKWQTIPRIWAQAAATL